MVGSTAKRITRLMSKMPYDIEDVGDQRPDTAGDRRRHQHSHDRNPQPSTSSSSR
jgi:hypothetical protein